MCGRFSINPPLLQIEERFNAKASESTVSEYKPRYNAAPMQFLPIIANDDSKAIVMARWGFLPGWAKDESVAQRMINARSEGIKEKRAYKHYFYEKRCIIPANSFFEWSKTDKQPYAARQKGSGLFSFAGLWSIWNDQQGNDIRTFTIITASANKKVSIIHNRMPVILKKEDEIEWLRKPGEELLRPLYDNATEIYPVSKKVNSVGNNSEDILKEISIGESQQSLEGF